MTAHALSLLRAPTSRASGRLQSSTHYTHTDSTAFPRSRTSLYAVLSFPYPYVCSPRACVSLAECLTAPGGGKTLIWSVTIDGQKNRDPVASYGAPQVLAIARADAPQVQLPPSSSHVYIVPATRHVAPYVSSGLHVCNASVS